LQGSLFGTSSATTDKNGALWFGGANGINYFTPGRESYAPVRTGVVFSSIKTAGNQMGETSNPIVLYYPDNSFTADFSTLSYTTSNHVRYRYRLDGYDEEWHYIEAGQIPTASYTRLPYGKMKLLVEASDWQDWSGNSTALIVNSRGPWWSSWWAITAYIILALLIIAGIIYYFISWTRMKQAIAIRRDKEEHEQEMMQMKMKFFTDVSHEFRTPLTLIRHAAGELQRNTSDNDRYVRLIARNAGVLTNMVNELLDFHRADMKSTPLRTTLTSVAPMITSIVEEFRGWAEGSDISINLEFLERDLEMWLDREQLSKIISNIISNSIRYTDGGGQIDITVSTGLYQDVKSAFADKISLVSDMIPGKQLIIKIKDSGIGIKPELLPVIFERFRQTHGQVRTANGSGIGLSLVKYLIELHHGGISVSSAENEGTEVIIFIPMTYDYLTPDQKVSESTFDMKEYLKVYGAEYETIKRQNVNSVDAEPSDDRPLIMIVDDNKEILDLLYDFFINDYDVVIAESAEEALEKASQKLPDLIISDIMMPGIDGIEFCRRLKTNLHTCHIPVILLTAMAHEENQIEGIEVGADAYVAKPFNPRLLTATVKNLINRNRRENTDSDNAAAMDNAIVSVRQDIKDRKERELFERFEALVRENFTNYDYTVENIWKGLGINRTRLYNLVKDTTGMSLGNYIKKLRLEHAAELLLTTDLSIAEIAYRVGIESHAYFTRSFRQQYNMSPTEWIKNHQKTDEK
ncbi:MAG: response regulator, partial [Muribaculaceae bacterium]|nr:response regulator [Muribaculaceae bacterium]